MKQELAASSLMYREIVLIYGLLKTTVFIKENGHDFKEIILGL